MLSLLDEEEIVILHQVDALFYGNINLLAAEEEEMVVLSQVGLEG